MRLIRVPVLAAALFTVFTNFGATVSAAATPGAAVFVGDFETGDLSQWAYVERCQQDRIVVYSATNAPPGAPVPRQGNYAVQFRVLDTDVAPCTSSDNPRAEIETSESLFRPGDEYWEAWSLYVPASYPRPNCPSCTGQNWFAFQEDYGPPWDGSPSIGWFLDFANSSPRIRMDRGADYNHDQPLLSNLATGRWVDFLVHKKFANTPNGGGFIEAWIDKVPMTFSACNCTKLSTQTMHTTQRTLGFYLTSYRARGTFASFVTYYDGVRIGATRAAVESCTVATDCPTGLCSRGVCSAGSCQDGQRNGKETDVDCGGSDGACPPCANGRRCRGHQDCASRSCAVNTSGPTPIIACTAPSCHDGAKNGSETDIDCGGADGVCPGCVNGRRCRGNGDCASSRCGVDTSGATPTIACIPR